MKTIIPILASLLVAACAGDTAPDRDVKVGRDYRLFSDEQRSSWIGDNARPLATTIWYPTSEDAKEELWEVAVFKAGWSAFKSPLLRSDNKYPLIILSHGTGGSAMQLSWLAEQLVVAGNIVVAVNHHGNTAFEEKLAPQGFVLWWERSRDISVVIDKMLSESRFADHIDADRIGAAGFSLGGYTVLSVVGGITSLDKKSKFCNQHPDEPVCQLPPEAGVDLNDIEDLLANDKDAIESVSRAGQSYFDARVKAVMSIAPVHVSSFTVASLERIEVPVRLVVGSADKQATPKYNANVAAHNIKQSELTQLDDVSHYTFLSPCNAKGLQFVKNLCVDQNGVDRVSIHDQVGLYAVRFFARNL